MVFTETKQKNDKKYYYRVKSIREGKRIKKERIYLGVNLTEEELSIFDLLYKSDLNPDEERQVKKASHELLEKIKDKLGLEWRKHEDTRSKVEVAIEDYLFYNLPRSYDWWLLKFKSHQVYMHVYESYAWVWNSVYEIASNK